jgi:hypothetical protein
MFSVCAPSIELEKLMLLLVVARVAAAPRVTLPV